MKKNTSVMIKIGKNEKKNSYKTYCDRNPKPVTSSVESFDEKSLKCKARSLFIHLDLHSICCQT